MRNYSPSAGGDPVFLEKFKNEPLYTFNTLVLRFRTNELQAYLRAEADRIEGEAKSDLARTAAMLDDVETRGVEVEGYSPAKIIGALQQTQDAEKIRGERATRNLRFVADHLAPDATFELDASDLLAFVERAASQDAPYVRAGLVGRTLGHLRRFVSADQTKMG